MLTYTELGIVFLYKNEEKTKMTDLSSFLLSRGASRTSAHRTLSLLQDEEISDEAIEALKDKYGTDSTEVLLNDHYSMEEKVTLYFGVNGHGTSAQIVTFLVEHPLLLTSDRRTVEKEVNSMVKKNILGMKDGSFWMNKASSRSVILGQRNISSDICGICGSLGLVHLAIKICDKHPIHDPGVWTEVMSKWSASGSLVLDHGCAIVPVGVPHVGVVSSTGTAPVVYLGRTAKSDVEISLFKRAYTRDNPRFSVSANCITYASSLATFLGTPN